MTNQSIAKRYAKALFDIGEERGQLDTFAASMEQLGRLVTENEEIKELINSYFVSISKKKEVMNEILANEDIMIRNFIDLLLDKNRAMNIPAICEAFEILMEEKASILHATVKSAVPLDAAQVEQIEQKFSSLTNQTVKAKVTVDPSLIGGVTVRVGDKVYDGSLAHQLHKLGDTLKKGEDAVR